MNLALIALVVGMANAAGSVHIGKFESRGIFHAGKTGAPAILMLPGSGAQGPEERVPAQITTDGKEHSVFNELAEPFDAKEQWAQLRRPGAEGMVKKRFGDLSSWLGNREYLEDRFTSGVRTR